MGKSEIYSTQLRPMALWFSGYSASGKSSIAERAQSILQEEYGIKAIILDGDVLRKSLCSDLGFSQDDRSENLRRAAELAKILVDNNHLVLCSFITPMEKQRQMIHSILGDRYQEVFIDTELSICEKRDPKNLYVQARQGKIKDFTGISSPYEAPLSPDIRIQTSQKTIEESSLELVNFLKRLNS